MVSARLTWIAAVGLLASTASAAERSAAFGVTLRVVSTVSVRTPATASWIRTAPAAEPLAAAVRPGAPSTWVARVAPLVRSPGVGASIPLAAAGAARSRPCQPTGCAVTFSTAEAGAVPDVVITVLPDGTPTAIVDG